MVNAYYVSFLKTKHYFSTQWLSLFTLGQNDPGLCLVSLRVSIDYRSVAVLNQLGQNCVLDLVQGFNSSIVY